MFCADVTCRRKHSGHWRDCNVLKQDEYECYFHKTTAVYYLISNGIIRCDSQELNLIETGGKEYISGSC